MHRRPTTTGTTASTAVFGSSSGTSKETSTSTTTTNTPTTAHNVVMGDGTKHYSNANHSNGHAEPVSVVRSKMPVRRRRKKTAFSTYYNSSIWKDDTIRVMAAIIAVLVVLILIGVVAIVQLLNQRNAALTAKATAEIIDKSAIRENTLKDNLMKSAPDATSIVPHSMSHIGDKSEHYAQLRADFEAEHPYDPQRSIEFTKSLIERTFESAKPDDLKYDIYNCPDQPPHDYPQEWNTVELLDHWKPHDYSNVPSEIYQGLCVFDYHKDYVKVLNYRTHEVPFIVQNDPYVAMAAERWNTPGYLEEMLQPRKRYRAEYSENNHFMYHVPPKRNKKQKNFDPKSYKPPTQYIKMTYPEWVEHANVTDESLLGPDNPHWYFRLIGCGEMADTPAGAGQCDPSMGAEYLFDELTFFQPKPDQLYIVNPDAQKGIHCRFGMKGVTAENHFDAARNSIVVLGGMRRYILSHPKHCENMALYPKGHPSARHSAVNWADPDLEEYPQFQHAKSNEVVLQAGDVLYLPNYWFHYIISLSLNFQCNTRSGVERSYFHAIQGCGFG